MRGSRLTVATSSSTTAGTGHSAELQVCRRLRLARSTGAARRRRLDRRQRRQAGIDLADVGLGRPARQPHDRQRVPHAVVRQRERVRRDDDRRLAALPERR